MNQKVVAHEKGIFVKHIQAETGARVQIKGRGSGFMETDTGRESDEPMHINIACVSFCAFCFRSETLTLKDTRVSASCRHAAMLAHWNVALTKSLPCSSCQY